jgi:hypothetical protein
MQGRDERRHGGGATRARVAAFALAALLGGNLLPVLGLALADPPAPLCCGKGRCCCAGRPTDSDDRLCMRRACGCGHEDATSAGEPLRLEAVLPGRDLAPLPEPRPILRALTGESPIALPHAPPVPPPRRSLPA